MLEEKGNSINELVDEEIHELYGLTDLNSKGKLTVNKFWKDLGVLGIHDNDNRLTGLKKEMEDSNKRYISEQYFDQITKQNALVKNALLKNLAIPDFEDFRNDVTEIFNQTKANQKGNVADYIPQLARVDPEQFAVSICTVDGQRLSLGDSHTKFCLQSTCKPINYCIAVDELGEDTIHKHIGREPSGRSFNELSLNKDGLPHNPLINSGAIMAASLIKRDLYIADRFDYVLKKWESLCGGNSLSFNNSVYLSERRTADRNFALAYFMRENKAFPPNTDIVETLEFYFQCCSIESKTHDLSVAAATLANGGVNPFNGKAVFNEHTVQNCLSLMLSCGMYDFSGEFAFKIGVPAKSGVSGAMLVVVPNLLGISIWSPRLDELGNSVRGVEFCNRLVKKYALHAYDALSKETKKKNPRKKKYESQVNNIVNLIWAASNGDLKEVRRLYAEGVDLSMADYDGRTPLHLAASEGKTSVVEFLLRKNVDTSAIDRWGGSPLDDAKKSGNKEVIRLIEEHQVADLTENNI